MDVCKLHPQSAVSDPTRLSVPLLAIMSALPQNSAGMSAF
jgi:hypothetical protein